MAELSPGNPPVFNCVVHVAPPDPGGRVVARVANLPQVSAQAASERQALAAVVSTVKRLLVEWLARGQPIPWIDPPAAPQPGEQTRYIAVHL